MTDKPRIVTAWLGQAWKWSIMLSLIGFALWVAAIIACVFAVAGRGWTYPAVLGAAAFVATVLVQVLRVGVLCAMCLQTIAGYDVPGVEQGPPLAPEGGQ